MGNSESSEKNNDQELEKERKEEVFIDNQESSQNQKQQQQQQEQQQEKQLKSVVHRSPKKQKTDLLQNLPRQSKVQRTQVDEQHKEVDCSYFLKNYNEEMLALPLRQEGGYRVLGVQETSPASHLDLVYYFDYIVSVNHISLREPDDKALIKIILEHKDKPLTLTIFNSKACSLRNVILTPHYNWEGNGLLGITIKYDILLPSKSNAIRVLDVIKNSPGYLGGLEAMVDYLLGTNEKIFRNTDILEALLIENIDKVVEIFVYNSLHDEVRLCLIRPTRKWTKHVKKDDGDDRSGSSSGGEGDIENGCFGCSVGVGYLHELPAKRMNTNGVSSLMKSYAINPSTNDDNDSNNGGRSSKTNNINLHVDQIKHKVKGKKEGNISYELEGNTEKNLLLNKNLRNGNHEQDNGDGNGSSTNLAVDGHGCNNNGGEYKDIQGKEIHGYHKDLYPTISRKDDVNCINSNFSLTQQMENDEGI